jgi:hypothetical protein
VDLAADVDVAMAARGATPRELPPVLSTEEAAVAERIERLASGVYSFTWQADEETRRSVADRTRRWAERHLGSPFVPRPLRRWIAWRAYDR